MPGPLTDSGIFLFSQCGRLSAAMEIFFNEFFHQGFVGAGTLRQRQVVKGFQFRDYRIDHRRSEDAVGFVDRACRSE